MKKLYSMICICGLIIAMVGMISIRPAIGQECVPVEVDVKPGRRNTIRLGSWSWVPIIIFSDPEAGFHAVNIDVETVLINGNDVQPLGAILIDRNLDATADLVLFYLANKLNLVEEEIEDGKIDITVTGNFVVGDPIDIPDPEAEEEIDCFEGTDTVNCTIPRFNFGANLGALRDRWSSRRAQ